MEREEFFIEIATKQEAGAIDLAFALSDVIEEFNLTGVDTGKIKEILDYHEISYTH